ncbi:hypothetical protein LI87_0102455 [Stenotrophomonas maltophilia]|nr:hypothetical protein LI87_0102455 [Stenotrophomonas maltophilia]
MTKPVIVLSTGRLTPQQKVNLGKDLFLIKRIHVVDKLRDIEISKCTKTLSFVGKVHYVVTRSQGHQSRMQTHGYYHARRRSTTHHLRTRNQSAISKLTRRRSVIITPHRTLNIAVIGPERMRKR